MKYRSGARTKRLLIFFSAAWLLLLFADAQGTAQNEVGDPLAPEKPPAALSGNLSLEELSGKAEVLAGSHTVNVSITNNGKRALLLDSDRPPLLSAAEGQRVLKFGEIISPPTKRTLLGDGLEVSSSVASAGLLQVSVDAYDKRRNPGPAFYGKDEAMRDLAEIRFGKRLVLPGETSSGEIYLKDAALSPGTKLSIPVFSHPEGLALGNFELSLTVVQSAGAAGESSKVQRRQRTEAERLPGELEQALEKKQRRSSRKEKPGNE